MATPALANRNTLGSNGAASASSALSPHPAAANGAAREGVSGSFARELQGLRQANQATQAEPGTLRAAHALPPAAARSQGPAAAPDRPATPAHEAERHAQGAEHKAQGDDAGADDESTQGADSPASAPAQAPRRAPRATLERWQHNAANTANAASSDEPALDAATADDPEHALHRKSRSAGDEPTDGATLPPWALLAQATTALPAAERSALGAQRLKAEAEGPGSGDGDRASPVSLQAPRTDGLQAGAASANGPGAGAAMHHAAGVEGKGHGKDPLAGGDEALALFKPARDDTLARAGAEPLNPAPLPAFAAELMRAGQALATPAAERTRSASTELQLHTPVNAPEFASRVSTELAVLARDGVHEARLHLNPAEMGPIAVQITVEGQAAQVNLAASHEQTRQALEQAMPTLAAALRETGLTLTGGGVFQQSPQHSPQSGRDGAHDGRNGSGQPGRPGVDGAGDIAASDRSSAALAPRRTRLPGQIDVYA